jgi:predicted DNA-binding transcriptional regulator AlpA
VIVTVDTDDLVTAAQIAERYDMSRSVVGNWTRRYEDFPRPVLVTDKVKLWSWAAVEAWNKEAS